MASRWSAWMVWAALAASLVFWGLRLGTRAGGVPAQVQTVASDQSARGDILRLFANPAAPAAAPAMQATAASRMRLLGVVAGFGDDARGWVVLSVDGKPARTLKVGALVEGDWVIQTVTNQRVEIGPRGALAVAVLELPLPAAAATGQLPSAGQIDAASPPLQPSAVPPVQLELPPAAGGVEPGMPMAPMDVPVGRAPSAH